MPISLFLMRNPQPNAKPKSATPLDSPSASLDSRTSIASCSSQTILRLLAEDILKISRSALSPGNIDPAIRGILSGKAMDSSKGLLRRPIVCEHGSIKLRLRSANCVQFFCSQEKVHEVSGDADGCRLRRRRRRRCMRHRLAELCSDIFAEHGRLPSSSPTLSTRTPSPGGPKPGPKARSSHLPKGGVDEGETPSRAPIARYWKKPECVAYAFPSHDHPLPVRAFLGRARTCLQGS